MSKEILLGDQSFPRERSAVQNQKPQITVLKLNKEFKRAYYQGKFKAHPLLVSYRVKNRMKKPRVGITTSKKIGCAVERNRARRIIRQAYRELLADQPELFGGNDFVFVARDKTAEAKTNDIKKVMRKHLTHLQAGTDVRGTSAPQSKENL